MAKAPVLGRVKTRLAADIGAVAATAFYRTQVARLWRSVARDPRWETVMAVSPDISTGWTVWPKGSSRIPQGAGDLGRRMDRLARLPRPGPLIIVGCDIPDLGAELIADGFKALGDADAVVGPASDGGFYLVGFKRVRALPDAFSGVRWSGPHALSDTLDNLDTRRVATLPVLDDVDTGGDWSRWRKRNGAG